MARTRLKKRHADFCTMCVSRYKLRSAMFTSSAIVWNYVWTRGSVWWSHQCWFSCIPAMWPVPKCITEETHAQTHKHPKINSNVNTPTRACGGLWTQKYTFTHTQSPPYTHAPHIRSPARLSQPSKCLYGTCKFSKCVNKYLFENVEKHGCVLIRWTQQNVRTEPREIFVELAACQRVFFTQLGQRRSFWRWGQSLDAWVSNLRSH